MKYVRQFGSIWELPEHKFKELLEAGAKAKSYNLNDYGRMIIHRDDIIEPIDWDHSDFKVEVTRLSLKEETKRLKLELMTILMAIYQRHPSKMTDPST